MDAKPWWESKAQWGLLLAALGFVLQGFGIAFDAAAATEVVWSFVQAIGLVLAFYGNAKRMVPLDLKQILPGLRLK
jgi:hypothetical protein